MRFKMKAVPYLTIGELCARYPGLQAWRVRRIFERKLLPEPPRINGYRVIPVRDLSKVVTTLRNAGYLPGSKRPILVK